MKLLKSFLVAASLALPAMPAYAADYRMLSSWDENYAYNPYLVTPFVDGVREATEGRVNITVNGPETVPPFEQLEPVGAGVFDFLFTHGAYHFGTSPIMTAADALQGDLETVRASGVFDVLDKHYQQFGLKLVMLPITPEGAYHIILREPVSETGATEGRKIRGSLTYKGIVEMLGGVLTVMPASEIYTGLEKGVIDGAAWPIIGVMDYNWNEVAQYLLRPGFGVNYEPIFMNLDKWNALSEADQNAILEVSHKIEDQWFKDAPAVWKAEEEILIQRGMKVSEMGESQKAQLIDAWTSGLWALSAEQNPEATAELLEFARSKGLAK
jgi:TRAP-type C4-dicarboxylate transport system substrate-binding protein